MGWLVGKWGRPCDPQSILRDLGQSVLFVILYFYIGTLYLSLSIWEEGRRNIPDSHTRSQTEGEPLWFLPSKGEEGQRRLPHHVLNFISLFFSQHVIEERFTFGHIPWATKIFVISYLLLQKQQHLSSPIEGTTPDN
jgi:hypothetical protein